MLKNTRKLISLTAATLLLVTSLFSVATITSAGSTDTNLMLNATMMSVNGKFSGTGNEANDGDVTTNYQSYRDGYVSYDMGAEHVITDWVAVCTGSTFLHYSVQGSLDNNTWFSMDDYDNTTARETTVRRTLAVPMKARYIKLCYWRTTVFNEDGSKAIDNANSVKADGTGDNKARLCEFEVYARDVEAPTNLLRQEGVTFTHSGVIGDAYEAAVDGDRTIGASLVNEGCYIQADLGAPKSIERWVVSNWLKDGAPKFYASLYSLWVSNDGVDFTKVDEWDNVQRGLVKLSQEITNIELNTPVIARYVRLQFNTNATSGKMTVSGDNQIRLLEFEVYGEDVEIPADECFSDTVAKSVSEDVSGLAFRFDLTATGVEKDGINYVANSGKVTLAGVEYDVVKMGAVLSNDSTATLDLNNLGNRVIDIEGKKLWAVTDATVSYVVRLINIPSDKLDVTISARPYYVIDMNGVEVVIYGETVSASYNEVAA